MRKERRLCVRTDFDGEHCENLHVHSKLIQILTLTRPLKLSKNNTKRTFANAEKDKNQSIKKWPLKRPQSRRTHSR